MKTLNAKGKSTKQIERQVKRWFAKNPNRKVIQVQTDAGVITRSITPTPNCPIV